MIVPRPKIGMCVDSHLQAEKQAPIQIDERPINKLDLGLDVCVDPFKTNQRADARHSLVCWSRPGRTEKDGEVGDVV